MAGRSDPLFRQNVEVQGQEISSIYAVPGSGSMPCAVAGGGLDRNVANCCYYIVDQQLLKLFRLDSRHFLAFLLAEHDRLADELVQHDVVQNGVDVEQLVPSFGKMSMSRVRKFPPLIQCRVAGVCRARLRTAALIARCCWSSGFSRNSAKTPAEAGTPAQTANTRQLESQHLATDVPPGPSAAHVAIKATSSYLTLEKAG